MFILLTDINLNFAILDTEQEKLIDGFAWEVEEFPKTRWVKTGQEFMHYGANAFASEKLGDVYEFLGDYADRQIERVQKQIVEMQEVRTMSRHKK